MRNIVGICLTALAFSTAMNCHAAPVEIGSLAGMRTAKSTIELAGMNTEVRSVALGPQKDGLYLLVASRPDGQGVSESRLNFINSDEAGRIVSVPVSPAGQATNPSASPGSLWLATANHLASDASGRPYLLTMALNGTMKLHRLSSQGQSEQVFDVALDLPALAIRRFEAVADKGFLIVGSTGSLPALVMLDTAGRVLSRVVVADQGAAAVAAQVSVSGDFIALVESANYIDPRFWVGRVRADGSIAGKAEMAGKPLDLDVAPDGKVVVLLEQAGVAHRDVIAKGFDREFGQQWSRTVVGGQANTTGFRVAALRKGGYFLAGKRDRGLWLSRIDAGGVEMWSSWTDPRSLADLEMAVDVDLTSRGDEFAVAYTALVVRDRKQFGVVRTLQFRLE